MRVAEKYEIRECLAFFFSHARYIARSVGEGTSDVRYLQIRDGIVINEADDWFPTSGPVTGTSAKCS
jgi:hypothetical protein